MDKLKEVTGTRNNNPILDKAIDFTIGNMSRILEEKEKTIYDIENIAGLEGKYIVVWKVEDNYFISLSSNLGNYNKDYEYKFKGKNKEEIIKLLNEQLEKYQFEVPLESGKWR